jgi:hypothetical protein
MLQKITLSAENELVERACQRAKLQNTTLNAEFRRWLAQTSAEIANLLDRFDNAKPGKTFTREEMNER